MNLHNRIVYGRATPGAAASNTRSNVTPERVALERSFAARILTVLTVLTAAAACFGLSACGSTSSTPTPTATVAFSWDVGSWAPAADLDAMRQATQDTLAQHPMSPSQGDSIHFEGLSLSGDWAVAEGMITDGGSDGGVRGEGLVLLFQKTGGDWKAAYPGTVEFEDWLDRLPSELVSPETKQLLK